MVRNHRNLRYVFSGLTFLFLIVILGLFVYVFFNMDNIESKMQGYAAAYGCLTLFVAAFIADLLMQPIGPDVPIIVGLSVGLDSLSVVIVVILGSILASFVGYYLGVVWGSYGFRKLYGEKRYHSLEKKYKKRGRLGLLISALTPVPYVPFCWIAGIFEMKRRVFLKFGIIPRILRIVGVAYLTMLILSL